MADPTAQERRSGTLEQALGLVLLAAAYLIPTVVDDDLDPVLRYALLVGGLLSFVLGTAVNGLLRWYREKTALQIEAATQANYNIELRATMAALAFLVERASTATLNALPEAKMDLKILAVNFATEVIGQKCSTVFFCTCDPALSAPNRKLDLNVAYTRDEVSPPRPNTITEGTPGSRSLFDVIDQRAPALVEVSWPDRLPVWDSSGAEYRSMLVTPVFMAGDDYGVLVACAQKDGCFDGNDLDVLRLFACQLASGLAL